MKEGRKEGMYLLLLLPLDLLVPRPCLEGGREEGWRGRKGRMERKEGRIERKDGEEGKDGYRGNKERKAMRGRIIMKDGEEG